MKFLMLLITPYVISSVLLLLKMFGYINLNYWMVFTPAIFITVAIVILVVLFILYFH